MIKFTLESCFHSFSRIFNKQNSLSTGKEIHNVWIEDKIVSNAFFKNMQLKSALKAINQSEIVKFWILNLEFLLLNVSRLWVL